MIDYLGERPFLLVALRICISTVAAATTSIIIIRHASCGSAKEHQTAPCVAAQQQMWRANDKGSSGLWTASSERSEQPSFEITSLLSRPLADGREIVKAVCSSARF